MVMTIDTKLDGKAKDSKLTIYRGQSLSCFALAFAF